MPVRRRPGSSLVEAVAVMTLSSIVMAIIAGILAAQLRLARATADRAAAAETVRTVTHALSAEARRMTAADIRASSSDSLAIRAFRGAGIPCATGPDGVLVRFTGDRMPDPAKDSVLVLGAAPEAAHALLDSAPAAALCNALPGETVLQWRTAAMPPPGSLLLVFESGSYHFSAGALRYRIGAGGRQPLTAEALRHPFTRFAGVSAGAVRFQIQVDDRTSEHAAAFGPGAVQP